MTEVAWLTSSYPWLADPLGGIFFGTQSRALARAGARLTVVAPVPAAPWPLPHLRRKWRSHSLAPAVQQDGTVTILRPRYPNLPGQPSWARPDRFIADAAWRTRDRWAGASLIHAHYSLIGLAGQRLAARARIPYVLTFHGSDLNAWPDLHPERLDDLRTAIRQAAAVFTVSRALGEVVRSLASVEAIHLPLGVDHGEIAASSLPRSEARRALGLPQNRLLVLFVGRLVPAKGVRELVSAVLELGDPFTAVLVGPGPLAGLGADDPRGADRLLYPGPQSHEQVVRYMAASDVLVLPSYSEGLPTVLVEGGSLGLPVIASGVGGIPELLGRDRGVILPEISADAVRDALATFAAAPHAALAASEQLRELVVREYDVDRNAERLLAAYREVAASRQ